MTAVDAAQRTYSSSIVAKVSGLHHTAICRHVAYQQLPPVDGRRRWTLGQLVTTAVVADEGRGRTSSLGPLLELLCRQLPELVDGQAPDVARWVIVHDEELIPVGDLLEVMDLFRRGHLVHVVDLAPILDRVAAVTADGRAPP